MKELLLCLVFILGSTLGYSQYKDKLKNKALMDSLIRKHNILHPDKVLRQAMYESGWLQCRYCSMKYNNPFGFRHKDWITEENSKGYIIFQSLEEAVKYYARWQKKYYHGGDYYAFIDNIGYAEKKGYTDYLKIMW
jgi:hypothetical protein